MPIKRTAIVNHCLSCGYRETRVPPAPERCPRCHAGLARPPINGHDREAPLRKTNGTGEWRMLGEGL